MHARRTPRRSTRRPSRHGSWRTLVLCASVVLLLATTGCVSNAQRTGLIWVGGTRAAVIPPLGLLFSTIRAPTSAGAPNQIGTRSGRATTHQIAIPPIPGISPAIPLVAWGDASREAAASAGGLQEVDHMDYELTTVLMVYRRFTLVAHGE